MEQSIKIIPDHQRTVLTPSMRRAENEVMAVDYGEDLEVVEAAEELNEAAKLKESSTFDADIPYNTNNRWIVNSYGESIPILINAHGLQLPDRKMQVNGYSEANGIYDVSFVRSQDWPEILKNLAINEIDGFEPFQLSEAFIDDNQLNDAAYPGAGLTPTRGFYTPVAYYGGLQRFNEANSLFELTYADFRPWFHYGKLLEQFFFAAGWKMDCPFLLTEYGQRLGWYLTVDSKIYDGPMASSFGSYDFLTNKIQIDASEKYSFRAEKTANQSITGVPDLTYNGQEGITFQDDSTGDNFDNGSSVANGFFNAAGAAVSGFSGKWKYEIRLIITGAAAPVVCRFAFMNQTFAGGFVIETTNSQFFNVAGELLASTYIDITIPGGSTTEEYVFYVQTENWCSFKDIRFCLYNGTGNGITILAGSTISGTCEYVIICTQSFQPPVPLAGLISQKPDIANHTILFPQSFLPKNIKAIEVLESYCHRTNSKIYTDRARRIVGIYTEHDVPTYGEATEPYYFDTIEQDMHLMQVEKSAQVNLKDVVAPAKYILGFKEATDAYIESITKDTPFDAVIDMTPYAENIDVSKEQENRDNLTEPTLERPFVEIKSTNPNRTPISVMAVLDNLSGEATAKVAPRTAYFYGLVKQKSTNAALYKFYVKYWGGARLTVSVFAYATQFPSGELTDALEVDMDNDKTLVYDHTDAATEPMKRYWLDTIAILYTAETRKLTVLVGSFNRFIEMNFRHLYRFKFMGVDWKGRLTLKRTKVNDFRRVDIEVREDKEC